jgi:hypothetical protein
MVIGKMSEEMTAQALVRLSGSNIAIWSQEIQFQLRLLKSKPPYRAQHQPHVLVFWVLQYRHLWSHAPPTHIEIQPKPGIAR